MKKMKGLWESYRKKAPVPTLNQGKDRDGIDKDKGSEYSSILDEAMQKLEINRPASQDEFEDYSTGAPCDIGKMSALEWWCQEQQKKRWPRLSYMAIEILSIPAMSDEPERVFSGARRTISWERTKLGVENIERGECLKHWKQSKLVEED